MPDLTVSPAGSVAGYSLKVWLTRNKQTLKVLASALGGYLTSLVGMIHDPGLNALASCASGVVIKLGLDALDFWLSDVPLGVKP